MNNQRSDTFRIENENSRTLSIYDIMEGIPEKKALLLADALLFAVYGWTPNKIRRMKMSTFKRWIKLAKKRMTFGDAYKMRILLEKKEKPLWKKILSRIRA